MSDSSTTNGRAEARVPLAPIDLSRSLGMQRLGKFDPTAESDAGGFTKRFFARTALSADGRPALFSARLRVEAGALVITLAGAEQAACEAVLARWLAVLPPEDGHARFAPEHALVRRLHFHELPGLRLIPMPWLFDMACSAVLQQRVTFEEARAEWRYLVEHFQAEGAAAEVKKSTPSPSVPSGLALPHPGRIARAQPGQLGRLGIDARRARTLVALAREEVMHPFLDVATPRAQLRARLLAIPGIGPWTTEMILGFGAADPDALIVGDLHLPHVVCWALAREPRGSDERMAELLAPFAGQRFRVTRLLSGARITPPRVG